MSHVLVALLADGDDDRLRDEAAGRVAIGRVRAVATHAGHSHGVVLPEADVRRELDRLIA